ncbi:MAG: BatA and WFA domain-containing protein [Sphingobacteriales bacterium]|nr:BatA and WFA domain-containing protein [Sphingobacteriales bacterium]
MNFLYPSFLWALAALAVPVIIHLFYFRRFKKVYFSSVQFLKEIKKESASRSRLKHLLILLSRLAAIAALVLAFAQPFLSNDAAAIKKGKKAVSVFVDNSFSMNARNGDVALLEQAKAKARQIAEAYSADEQFQILTNDFEGRHQRLIGKEEFLAFADEIQSSAHTQPLSRATDRQKQALENANADYKNIFIISDFQRNIVDFKNDSLYHYYLVPLQTATPNNVYVDSLWLDAPVQALQQSNKMLFRLTNAGNTAAEEVRVSLKINEQTKAMTQTALAAGETKTDTLEFSVSESGWQRGEFSITDYPIDFDDHYYFSFYIEPQLNILEIYGDKPNRYIGTLFGQEAYFNLRSQSVNQLDYSKMSDYRLIIINDVKNISSGLAFELKQYVENGGDVAVFPSIDAAADSYNAFLKSVGANVLSKTTASLREVSRINTQQEIFNDVFERIPQNLDLPTAKKSWEMSHFSTTTEEELLPLRDGGSLLSKYAVKDGKLYVGIAPLDVAATNLPAHAVFVPMLLKMAFAGSDAPSLSYTIGNNNIIQTRAPDKSSGAEDILKLRNKERGEFIPNQKIVGNQLILSLGNQLQQDGIFALEPEKDTTAVAYFGFNYNRKESDLKYLALDSLKQKYNAANIKIIDNPDADLAGLVGEIDQGVALWKWCLLAALLFLAIEVLLLRFWKT